MKSNLPKGCCYPNCFECPLPDCLLPDNEDLLKDGETVTKVDELKEQRRVLKIELQAKGIKTSESAEYHALSFQIHKLQNRDILKMRDAKRYRMNKHP